MRIYVMLGDGFEELEALSVVDVARRAGIDTPMVSVSQNKQVESARGIRIIADQLLDEIKIVQDDMIVIPGGKGVKALEESRKLSNILKEHCSNKGWIAAICAGPSIIGKLGLLEGRKAACYPGYEKYLSGANVVFDDVVVDENFITARGAGVSLAFAYEIVKAIKGASETLNLKKAMLFKY